MNFYHKYLEKVKNAILAITLQSPTTSISVKRIREYYHEKPKERSVISFYWRILVFLESQGILQKISFNSSIHQYKLISRKKLEELQL